MFARRRDGRCIDTAHEGSYDHDGRPPLAADGRSWLIGLARLADRIEEDLASLEPGAEVPSVTDLAATHGATPAAVGRALVDLERRFAVRKLHDRRVVVATRVEYRIGSGSPSGWTEAVRATGAEGHSEIERIRVRRVPPRVRMELALGRADRVYVLSRRRFIGSEPAACSVSYVVAELTPGLPERLAPDGSLQATLERYGLQPRRAWVRAQMDVPPPDIPRRVGLQGRPLMVSVRSRTDAGANGRPVEITSSWLRPDMFRVVLEVDVGSEMPPQTGGAR